MNSITKIYHQSPVGINLLTHLEVGHQTSVRACVCVVLCVRVVCSGDVSPWRTWNRQQVVVTQVVVRRDSEATCWENRRHSTWHTSSSTAHVNVKQSVSKQAHASLRINENVRKEDKRHSLSLGCDTRPVEKSLQFGDNDSLHVWMCVHCKQHTMLVS